MKTILKVELLDHVSAGQLRALGFYISDEIPDDWIIPKDALRPVGSVQVEMEGDTMHCSFSFRVSAPFRPPLEYELDV